jgi:hypothetical protein
MGPADKQMLTDQVESILEEPNNSTGVLEAERIINDAVFALFGLTAEERVIICAGIGNKAS